MSAKATASVLSPPARSFTPAPANLLQRKCECGGSAGLSGKCEACQQQTLTGQQPPLIQPKLKVSKPNDPYEQEADRVADEVMRMPEPKVQRQVGVEEEEDEETVQTKPIASQITPLVQRRVADEEENDEELQLKGLTNNETVQRQVDDEEDEDEAMQTKARTNNNSPDTNGIESEIESLRASGGNPLPSSARDSMEARFQQDFSDVRIHTDKQAIQTAKQLEARAFTLGSHIAFDAGQFSPENTKGKLLLAHELAHVVQQSPINPVRNTAKQEIHRKSTKASEKAIERKERRVKRWLRRTARRLERGKSIRDSSRTKRFVAMIEEVNKSEHKVNLESVVEEALHKKDKTQEVLTKIKQVLNNVEQPKEESIRTEGSSIPKFSLKGVPKATLEPQLRLVKDLSLLAGGGAAGLAKDFALTAAFEASGDVVVTGGTDEEVAQWEAGFLQTVISTKIGVTYSASKSGAKPKKCWGFKIKMPYIRDGVFGSSAPWYDSESTMQFVKPEEPIKAKMTDHPDIALKRLIPEAEKYRGSWGPLDETCGEQQFGTWLVVRHKKGGPPIYLYSWQWAVDYSAKFHHNKEVYELLATQKPPVPAEGKGSLEPALSGPDSNTMVENATKYVPSDDCQDCDHM